MRTCEVLAGAALVVTGIFAVPGHRAVANTLTNLECATQVVATLHAPSSVQPGEPLWNESSR